VFPYPFTKDRDPIDVILNEQVVPIEKWDKTLPKQFCDQINRSLSPKSSERHSSARLLGEAIRQTLT
jgi:hypothetical protein